MMFNDLNTIFGDKDGSDEDDILDPSPRSRISITRPKNCVIFYCFTLFSSNNNIFIKIPFMTSEGRIFLSQWN